jgi:hypothetical protein
MKKIILLLFIIFMGVQITYADVPSTVSFQGRLTNSSGIPVADSLYTISARLYDSEAAAIGAHVWIDSFDVQSKNGYFTIVFGSGLSPLTSLDFNQQYWVGVKVGADAEMTPRQALHTVPYAMNVSDDAIATAKIKDLAVTTTKIDDLAVTAAKIADTTITGAKIAVGTVSGGATGNITWGSIVSGNIGNGEVTQTNAPWAPWVVQGVSQILNPKIHTGAATTDVNGNINVVLSGFTLAPIVVATANRSDIDIVVRVYTITAAGFSIKSVNLSGTGVACTVNWVAIGN